MMIVQSSVGSERGISSHPQKLASCVFLHLSFSLSLILACEQIMKSESSSTGKFLFVVVLVVIFILATLIVVVVIINKYEES
jgi:hypothetical protein